LKSIAIFYASEGTGHRAAAENLRDWFLLENPGCRVLCRDVLSYIPSWLHHIVSDGYLFMARHAPWAWGWFYWGSDRPSLQAEAFDFFHSFLCRIYLPAIERDVIDIGAEAVIFTHYFGAPYFAERNLGKIPVFYVNTDFVSHRFQRHRAYRASFVASRIALKQYLDEGLLNTFDTGIPISPSFSLPPSHEQAKNNLKVNKSRKIITVSGGGIGAGAVVSVVNSLAARTDWQTVVVCGNNTALRKKLSAMHKNKEHVRIEGFVNNMIDYYCAADLNIIKPGGLSLSEALSVKTPLLLMDPIPGQEQLNLDYICGFGAAKWLKNPVYAAEEVSAVLEDKTVTLKMKEQIAKISRPEAAQNILIKIYDNL